MSQLDTPYCIECLSGETELKEVYHEGFSDVYVYECFDCGKIWEEDDE